MAMMEIQCLTKGGGCCCCCCWLGPVEEGGEAERDAVEVSDIHMMLMARLLVVVECHGDDAVVTDENGAVVVPVVAEVFSFLEVLEVHEDEDSESDDGDGDEDGDCDDNSDGANDPLSPGQKIPYAVVVVVVSFGIDDYDDMKCAVEDADDEQRPDVACGVVVGVLTSVAKSKKAEL